MTTDDGNGRRVGDARGKDACAGIQSASSMCWRACHVHWQTPFPASNSSPGTQTYAFALAAEVDDEIAASSRPTEVDSDRCSITTEVDTAVMVDSRSPPSEPIASMLFSTSTMLDEVVEIEPLKLATWSRSSYSLLSSPDVMCHSWVIAGGEGVAKVTGRLC